MLMTSWRGRLLVEIATLKLLVVVAVNQSNIAVFSGRTIEHSGFQRLF